MDLSDAGEGQQCESSEEVEEVEEVEKDWMRLYGGRKEESKAYR